MSNQLLYTAYSRALKTSYFHRDGGAETQAGKVYKDYSPDGAELLDYQKKVIERLLSIEGEEQPIAEGIIVEKFKQQFLEGNREAIYHAIKTIVERHRTVSNTLRQQITELCSERFQIGKEDTKMLQDLLQSHEPNDIKHLLELKVIVPPYESRREENKIVDVASEKARQFAIDLIAKKDFSWTTHLADLQRGEQRQTFVFAEELGKIVDNKEEILNPAIQAFVTVPFPEQNESFINGFLSGVGNEEFTRSTIDQILALDSIQYHAVRIHRFLKVTLDDLEKLKPMMAAKPDFIVGLQYLKYDSLSNEDLLAFFKWLADLSTNGNWLAIDIIERLVDRDDSRFSHLQELINHLVFRKGLVVTDTPHQLAFYQFELLIKRLIKSGLNKDQVEFLSNEILNACEKFVMAGEQHMSSILYALLDKYWEFAWPAFGAAILNPSLEGWYGVKSLLSGYKKYENHNFLDWVDTNEPNAKVFAVMILRFEVVDKDQKSSWAPLVKSLIDKYGADSRMMQELSARLHSFSATGSAMPIFTSRKDLVSTLLNHDKEEVRTFAKHEVEYFDRQIEQEKKFWQNHQLGELW